MCLYPILIQNKKYTKTKKNGGIIPAVVDRRTLAVPVGCGKCMECIKKKAREWQVRLLEDIRHEKNGIFVTLTFNNQSIAEIYHDIISENQWIKGYELDNKIATIATRRFLERWRKTYKKSLRHWLVTELGHNGTENIHLHGIIWVNKTIENPKTKEIKNSIDEIRNHWKYGYIWPNDNYHKNYVSEKTINYITKYINKQDAIHKEYKPKVLTSPGIGYGYTNRTDAKTNKYNPKKETKETYNTRSGHKISLPIYWRNKIYTEEEREKLWMEKLDKQIRYINGEKIDISNGLKEYHSALKYHRQKAKKLGYLDNEYNWTRIEYEEKRRMFNLEQRIKTEDK